MNSSKPVQIPIPWARPDFWGREREYVIDALDSTWISGGEYVNRLEREFAVRFGVRHALTASNGTAALHLAYLALGIRPGDEIVAPGFGFMAAANVALHLGARPVFAEVDSDTWCVTADTIEPLLTPRTRAIVPLHTYGNVCQMDEINALAERNGIPVVEDAAEALASRYKGRLAGTMSVIGSFSFQATKTITTGEGGMVVTASDSLRDAIALYRSHGMLRKHFYWHELPGHNFRLTNLQAALGCAQLERLDEILATRKRLHAKYASVLATIDGVTPQQFRPEVDPALWAIAVKLEPSAYPQGRDAVMQQLGDAGVETRPGFYPPSAMSFYACPPLPACEALSRQVISLPSYASLREEQVEYICKQLSRVKR
jgi:perosamine synthetase